MYQKVIVAGNLGADPEMRHLQDGTPVTNMSVATNRRWTNQQTGEQVEETVWFRVSVFGRQAEACDTYLEKGRGVLVEGRLVAGPNGGPKIWHTQDGEARASFELRADHVRFMGRGDDTGSGGGRPAQREEDEIPF